MKWYLYFVLIFLSIILAFSNVHGLTGKSFDLLRILYLEKTSFRDFSFSPFPLFVLLSYTLNVLLSVAYVASNSLKAGNSFVLSRFYSCKACYIFLCAETLKRILFCSFVQAMIPVAVSFCAMGAQDVGRVFIMLGIFFIRHTVLLGYGVFAAVVIRKKLMNAAAEVIGALLIMLLVLMDCLLPWTFALMDLSARNGIMIVAEGIVFCALLFLYFYRFRKNSDKLDERL